LSYINIITTVFTSGLACQPLCRRATTGLGKVTAIGGRVLWYAISAAAAATNKYTNKS
jgi:hypothetical protein